jgi:hypothetical protein
MIDSVAPIRVQLEIQQRGGLWHVKGCTVYGDSGQIRPIAIAGEPCYSRRVTIHTAKQVAHQELLATGLQSPSRIRWQVVLWFPERPIIRSRQIRAESAHQPHELSHEHSDRTELVPTG